MDTVIGELCLGDVFHMRAYTHILLFPKHTRTLMTTDKLLPMKCATGTCPFYDTLNTYLLYFTVLNTSTAACFEPLLKN
jgi:hypothetical protein